MSKYDKEYYHNKGQEDASDGKYRAPHGISDQIFTWSDSEVKRHQEENDAYDKGWKHTDDQISENNSGSCYLTTACVEHAGLPDDCHELQTLRQFRDSFVLGREDGVDVIRTYYSSAPTILQAIARSGTSEVEMPAILIAIKEAVALIDDGKLEDAFKAYSQLFERLAREYGS